MNVLKKTKDLFWITKRRNECLKDYVQRFNVEKIQIPKWNDAITIEAFQKGLEPKPMLCYELITKEPLWMEDVMESARGEAIFEEEWGHSKVAHSDSSRHVEERFDSRGEKHNRDQWVSPRFEKHRRRDERRPMSPPLVMPITLVYPLNISTVELVVSYLWGRNYVNWPSKMKIRPEERD